MNNQSHRQKFRIALIIGSFFLYPVTFAYISCPIITEGASLGIVTGGLIVFGLLFISSLFLGRLWCGYLCPSGGLQELYRLVYDRPLRTRKMNVLKYLIFLGIFGSLIFGIWSSGGLSTVDLFYGTAGGISLAGAAGIAGFMGPVIIVSALTLIFGRRGFCHTFCPIAVMLMTGRKIRNLGRWPALHIETDSKKCTDCKECSDNCPMSLNVKSMVCEGRMENADCILCGNCVDNCPNGAISYTWTER